MGSKDLLATRAWHALLEENGLCLLPTDLALDEPSLLEYLRAALESEGEDPSEEGLEGLVEVLWEFVPLLRTLDRTVICDWLIQLALSLREAEKGDGEVQKGVPLEDKEERNEETPTISSRHDRFAGACSSTSSSSSSTSSQPPSQPLRQLIEIFPGVQRPILRRCLAESGGEVVVAIEAVLSQLSDIDLSEQPEEEEKEEEEEEEVTEEEEKAYLRAAIIGQYSYVDVQSDKRTYRPPPPKYTEAKQRMRFLNGQSVDTRGQKYLEVKQPTPKDAPQPAFLKALKKYKKH